MTNGQATGVGYYELAARNDAGLDPTVLMIETPVITAVKSAAAHTLTSRSLHAACRSNDSESGNPSPPAEKARDASTFDPPPMQVSTEVAPGFRTG